MHLINQGKCRNFLCLGFGVFLNHIILLPIRGSIAQLNSKIVAQTIKWIFVVKAFTEFFFNILILSARYLVSDRKSFTPFFWQFSLAENFHAAH